MRNTVCPLMLYSNVGAINSKAKYGYKSLRMVSWIIDIGIAEVVVVGHIE